MSKALEILQAALVVLGALSAVCAAVGAVLPEGKAKTFFQLAGSRLFAASRSLGAKPVDEKKDGAS